MSAHSQPVTILTGEPHDADGTPVAAREAHEHYQPQIDAGIAEINRLREALKWALCHVEMKEDETDFHEQYERAYAAYKSSVPSTGGA